MIPPFWHRHPELLWELSALHLHWLCAYDPEQNGSAPLGWHRDFADARAAAPRLGRRLRHPPGPRPPHPADHLARRRTRRARRGPPITDRDEDFVQFVLDDVAARHQAEDAFYAGIDPGTGEV